MKEIDKALNSPSKKFKSIHVAGTNGKGSVSFKIANSLRLSGYKVGLFTSPHIIFFRERITINNVKIKKKEMEYFLNKIFKISENRLTFFEITTLLAFCYFCDKQVDFAVIEVGLGGRKDATNIITPELSIITSISFDHENILGRSLEKIAFEKAGIIKKNVPLIIGPKANYKSVFRKAKQKDAKIYKVQNIEGFFDLQNQEIAKKGLEVLKKKFFLSDNAINRGLLYRPKCRFEVIKSLKNLKKIPKKIILDVAHNPDGFLNLFKSIKFFYPNYPIRVVFGISKNKDIKSCIKIIAFYAVYIHLIDGKNERLISKKTLLSIFLEEKIYKVSYEDNTENTLNKAIKLGCKNKEILLICGSFFIMKDILHLLGGEKNFILLHKQM
ncbi:MAG: hypothetical protein AMS24_00855 [Chlamydiae bacterium SM23_39]|nr:MAG: hypothetical protein AMS24_00855 [Chlamydiae bacterium SM23_39]